MLSSEDKPVTASTKVCQCGNAQLVELTSLNLKQCTDCRAHIPWLLERGQASLYGSHRAGRLLKESREMNVIRMGEHDLPLPERAKAHDLGYDLRTTVAKTLAPGERFMFPTGFAFQFLPAQGGLLWPRSGLANKHGIAVMGGVVDGGYQGEVMAILINHGSEPVTFAVGDRIAQMLLVTRVSPSDYGPEMCEVDSFTVASDRGAAGFGSSGLA